MDNEATIHIAASGSADMISLISDNLEAIRDLCGQHGIKRLDLFGSAATGAFNPETSDIDFIVDLGEYAPGTADRLFSLIEDLETLLRYRVQIVTVRSITNPYFRQSVNEQRVNVYEPKVRQAAA